MCIILYDCKIFQLLFRAEMEEIKREILSLSEKYSIKCVESAALEEELRNANNQLAQAQHHITQLDNRLVSFSHIFSEYVYRCYI